MVHGGIAAQRGGSPRLPSWYTDILKAPKGDQAPQGWPTPGKAPRY
jgi:hypothetical protein